MKITVSLPDTVVDRLDRISTDLGINRSATVSVCISEYQKQKEAISAINGAVHLMQSDK